MTINNHNPANVRTIDRVQNWIWCEQAYVAMGRANRNMKRNQSLAEKNKGTTLEAKYATLAFKWQHKLKALNSLVEFLQKRALY